MSNKDTKTPEFLRIKGYKYRAKMLIAAAVVITVFLIIIISVIHGISSAVTAGEKTDSKNEGSDTIHSVITDIDSDSEDYDTEYYSLPDTNTDSEESLPLEEKFDADGKLIIDTDTLDGQKAVAITFDDGPGEYTRQLVEGLNQRNVKATFFMVGSCVEQYPDVLPMMVEGGHQLGSHTYNHTDITSISNKEMNDQISKTDNAVYQACGQIPTAFRPPYGAYTDDTLRVIHKTVALWSVDTVDWNLKNSAEVKDTIVSQCKDGDIILLHDIHKNSVEGSLLAIDELLDKGFVFVTVDQLLTRYGYGIDKGKPHTSQYAVYETNSPDAKKYLKEIKAQKEEKASSSAADSFYYERTKQTSDTDSEQINRTDSEKDKKPLIY